MTECPFYVVTRVIREDGLWESTKTPSYGTDLANISLWGLCKNREKDKSFRCTRKSEKVAGIVGENGPF